MDCIKRSQEALSGRTWMAVKFFVKNEISRRSRKISKWHAYLRIFLAGGVWCMVTLIYDDPPSLLIWICCPGPPCNGNFLRSLPCLAFFSLWLIISWQDTAFLLISEHCLFVNVSEVYSSNKPGGLPPFLPCPNPKSHQSPLPHKKITVPYKPLVNRYRRKHRANRIGRLHVNSSQKNPNKTHFTHKLALNWTKHTLSLVFPHRYNATPCL